MSIFNNRLITPMLLFETDKPFNDKNYIYELKFDGIRAFIFANKKEIFIMSRNGFKMNDLFPELLNIKNIVKKDTIFDGEIVVLKSNKSSFRTLQERIHLKSKKKIEYLSKITPVTFVCFDIIYENKNLTKLSLIKRKKILNKYNNTNYFIKSKYIEENGIDLFREVKKLNLEGIVAKKKNSTYEINKRSKNWIKIKNLKDDDYLICGYKDGKGNLSSVLLGKKKNNNLIYIGKVTIGKRNEDYKRIKLCKKINNRFYDFIDNSYTYILPELTATISFLEITKSGSLRHPIFKNLKN